jgi:cation diffusion facilitator family transporter
MIRKVIQSFESALKGKGMKKDEGVGIMKFVLVGNIILMLLKGSVGLFADSEVLKADAVNSAGDVMSSLGVLLALRYAMRPRDEDHHYGHGKMEALVSLFVGIFIMIGIVFLVREIIINMIYCTETLPSFWALGAAAVSIAVKTVMYKKTAASGKRLSSIAIATSAKDHKNDILATSGAVVAIGLTFAGQQFGIRVLLLYAEPVIAAVMSLFIVKTAFEIISEACKMLLDAAPDKDMVKDVVGIAGRTDGVEQLNWVKLRQIGRGILADTAIEVNGSISVEDGHNIGDAVKFAIMSQYPQIVDVVVHINPKKTASHRCP